jgi:hypothetical protein
MKISKSYYMPGTIINKRPETTAYVYMWKQKSTGMWYIGSRTRKGCHPDDGYICSSNIVGPKILENMDDWQREILFIGEPRDMYNMETTLLQELNAKHDSMSYNTHNNNTHIGVPGVPHSAATRAKMSATRKGIPSHKKGKPGKPLSEEHRKKISEGMMGKNKNKPKGVPKSEATKAAMRASKARKKYQNDSDSD